MIVYEYKSSRKREKELPQSGAAIRPLEQPPSVDTRPTVDNLTEGPGNSLSDDGGSLATASVLQSEQEAYVFNETLTQQDTDTARELNEVQPFLHEERHTGAYRRARHKSDPPGFESNPALQHPSETIAFLLEEMKSLKKDRDAMKFELQALRKAPTEEKAEAYFVDEEEIVVERDKDLVNSIAPPRNEFPEDIYTLMYFSSVTSPSFLFGLSVCFTQTLIYSLTTYDLISRDDHREGEKDTNVFNIPVEVEPWVSIAQVIAILLSAWSRDDVTDTFEVFASGYKASLLRSFPAATRSKFYIANGMRAVQGCFYIFVSFILQIQSEKVISMFLNFAALEFVTNIDNLAYKIAASGWLLKSMKTMAEEISEAHLKITEDQDKIRRYPRCKQGLIMLLLISLLGGWARVYQIQVSGELLRNTACGTIEVHFGDQVLPIGSKGYSGFATDTFESTLSVTYDITQLAGSERIIGVKFDVDSPPDLDFSTFSGNYISSFDNLINSRPIYYHGGFKDITSGKFYYCDSEKAWVFTIEALVQTGAIPQETIGRCQPGGWLLRSPVTSAYSLEDAPDTEWKIWTGSLVAADFTFVCADCSSSIDCGVTRGKCLSSGRCNCSDAFEGNFCNDDTPCSDIILYKERDEATMFSTNKVVQPTAYERPLFIKTSDLFAVQAVIYNGRRWHLLNFALDEITVYFEGYVEDLTEFYSVLLESGEYEKYDGIRKVFEQYYHGYWTGLLRDNVIAFSEPTEQRSPTGELTWFEVKESRSIRDPGSFGLTEIAMQEFVCVSVDCSVGRVCGKFGQCEAVEDIQVLGTLNTGISGEQCICDGTFTGHYCQFANLVEFEGDNIVGASDLDPYFGACKQPYSYLQECYLLLYERYYPT